MQSETMFPGKQQTEYDYISYTCVDTDFADVHVVSDIESMQEHWALL
jgi:hypothetical protein